MSKLEQLQQNLTEKLSGYVTSSVIDRGELTLEVDSDQIKPILLKLRDEFGFEQLTDIVGVDYATYGEAEWVTDKATGTGFSRGADRPVLKEIPPQKRFAVLYQLLSLQHNVRVRLTAFLDADDPRIDSVECVYTTANWLEREVFDLFGILFNDHSDLRRILTDYGFIGYPFRKDFPISGHVEMRYDSEAGRVIYEPVDIEPRTLVARVIRHDHRYDHPAEVAEGEQK